ncbi:MAG TPA: RNA degradosome polyphosphate kinase [Lachnospiraceae bacterium]|nr:RNA degradosome polyphosphate kinase [Lachnospiraceae bacterium]
MDYSRPEYYTNREISWVRFNERVLSEARDEQIPLFERLKFLSITVSNLDEFFMIRVASLKDMVHAGYEKKDLSGLKPKEQLKQLGEVLHRFVDLQYETYQKMLVPQFACHQLHIIEHHEELNEEQQKFVDQYFMENVYPVLTPMAVDSSRPFPLIKNKSLNICALLSKKGEHGDLEFATVQVPSVLARMVRIDSEQNDTVTLIRLEEIIEKNISKLFLNYDVIGASPYRIMRNADLTIEEEEAEDLLKEIEKQIKKRQWGEVIRLEVEDGVDKRLLKILKKELNVSNEDIYTIRGPLDLTFLMKVYGMEGFEDLKRKVYEPQQVLELSSGCNIFDAVKEQDILLHHPYQTFEPVVQFIEQAAEDPKVLAIKQTLYRVSGNSPIVKALARAAENGKQVSVLVELKARFDEENNIVWAKMLEKSGCHVIYGLVGLKTHSKITLVVRQEEEGIRRYVHLGTGNYNDATAKLYSDLGLLTSSEAIGEDATAVFNMLSGYSEPLGWNKLSVAPLWLKKKLLKLIEREKEHAQKERQARIVAKMNSLCDPDIMAALYEASAAGVQIYLLIRGICCLKVGIESVSDNIYVSSIVGDYLEHGRIFYFENDLEPEIYMSSADWMPRNLERRVEIMFPIEEPQLKAKIMHILDLQFRDNTKRHILMPNGSYQKKSHTSEERLCCQEEFCKEAKAAVKKSKSVKTANKRVFTPKMHEKG